MIVTTIKKAMSVEEIAANTGKSLTPKPARLTALTGRAPFPTPGAGHTEIHNKSITM